MEFGKTTTIKSMALTSDLPDILYPQTDPDAPVDPHKETLADVVRLLRPIIGSFPKGYNLVVVKEAMDAFCAYGNEVYWDKRKEATGLHLGYYVHAPEDPEIKVGIATTFMEARGDASAVTCEISHEDGCRAILEYGNKHRLLVIDWPHTHPGFGVFYSDTDCNTLRTTFNAEQHAGIVVDNLKGLYLAYKIIAGRQVQIPIWGFSLEAARRGAEIGLFQYQGPRSQARKSISMGQTTPSGKKEPTMTMVPQTPVPTPSAKHLPDIAAELTGIKERLKAVESSLDSLEAVIEQLGRAGKPEGPEEDDSGEELTVVSRPSPPVPVGGLLAFVALTYCFTFAMYYLKTLMP